MTQVPEERPAGNSFKPLRGLVPYLLPHWPLLAVALGALLVAAAAMLALPIALRYLIDQGLAVRDAATINRYFVAFLAAAVVFGTFAALRFYMVTWLGERVVADIRNAVYARVIRMDPSFFEVTRTGEVLSRLTADTTLVQSIAGYGISITLRSIISLVGSLVLLSRRACGSLIIVMLMPFVVVPLFVLGRRRAPAVARFAGSHRGCERARGGDAERGADGAGVHARGAADGALSRRGRALVPRRDAAHPDPRRAHRARYDAGVRRVSRSCSGSARTKSSRATSRR